MPKKNEAALAQEKPTNPERGSGRSSANRERPTLPSEGSTERKPVAQKKETIDEQKLYAEAKEFRRETDALIDRYQILQTQYRMDPTNKDQKNELQAIWNNLRDRDAKLADFEFTLDDPSMARARKDIANLPSFLGQETLPEEKEKAALETGTEIKLRHRDVVKRETKENIRNKEQIKVLRGKLARLKSAFAGAYKLSPARAHILLSQPSGLMGALKGLYEGKAPTSEERKKLKALKSEDAQEQLKDIQNLETRINEAWKQAKKEEIEVDFYNKGAIEEIELDDTVSIQTLREVANQEIEGAKEIGDSKKAQKILDDLNHAISNIYDEFPDLRPKENSEELDAYDESKERKAIVPPSPEIFEIEKQQENNEKIESAIKAFGGGEAGRKYAADLWKYANNQIKEKGSIKLQGEKGAQKDAMAYVQAFAEKVTTSNEVLGRERSAQIWQEINDHRNELLKSPSMKAAERKKLEALDPIYYVNQSALRDKALQEEDLDAAGKHNDKIDGINKLLGYPEGMNPSTGEGMGRAPQKETRALGKNIARQEASTMAAKTTGARTRSFERGSSKRERISEEAYTIEWAANLLPNTRAEWDNVSNLIKTDAPKTKKVINNEIKDVVSGIQDVIDSGAEVSDEYHGLKKLPRMRTGSPAEATRYVMLKALSELAPQTEDDEAIQRRLVDAVADIDHKLADLQGPSVETSEVELSDSVREAVKEEGIDVEVQEPTANEKYIAREAAELVTKAENLDKLTEKEIANLAKQINQMRPKNVPTPKDFNEKVKNELRKFYTALNEDRRATANLAMGRLSKYLRDKIDNKDLNKVREMLSEAKQEFLEAA
jgi:hypothetical protein